MYVPGLQVVQLVQLVAFVAVENEDAAQEVQVRFVVEEPVRLTY